MPVAIHAVFAHFQVFFRHYGLAAVAAVLVLENLGLPLPGEVALLYAAYQGRVQGIFPLSLLIVVGVAGAAAGQAAGYGIGRYAGAAARRLFHLTHSGQAKWGVYFERHGAVTIIGSRFVAGLRVLAGPLAGIYHMPWRRFLWCDLVGALAWVTAVSATGWMLGAHWQRLLHHAAQFDLLAILVAVAAVTLAWRRLSVASLS